MRTDAKLLTECARLRLNLHIFHSLDEIPGYLARSSGTVRYVPDLTEGIHALERTK